MLVSTAANPRSCPVDERDRQGRNEQRDAITYRYGHNSYSQVHSKRIINNHNGNTFH